MNELFNLNDVPESLKKEMENNKVKFGKFQSKLTDEIKQDAKLNKCFYCKKPTKSFCNSHTIPEFILRSIAESGELFSINKIVDIPLRKPTIGVKNTGTFHIICRDCDSQIFQEYENPENYNSIPTEKMIAQMAMKNHLKNISKRLYEQALYNKMFEMMNVKFGNMLDAIKHDLREDIQDFKHAKKVIEKSWRDEFYLIFHHELNYTVPIAFQGHVTLLYGLNGEIINNVFDTSENYKTQPLHISVFPLENKSVIMLFIKDGNKHYRSFYKEFNKLSLDQKLSAINYMIFSLSEEFYINKSIRDKHIGDKNLERVTGLVPIIKTNGIDEENHLNDSICEEFSFSDMNSIPNFLAMEVGE